MVIMKKFFALIPLLTLLYGCASNPPKEVYPFRLPDPAAPAETLENRLDLFRQAVGNVHTSGTWLYPKNFENDFTPEEVIAMVKEFGYNRVYCRITSETELNDYFLALLVAAENANIKTEIVMDLFSFYSRKGSNTIWSFLLPDTPGIPEMVKLIIKRFKSDKAYSTLDGIAIVINPHRFTIKNLDYPKGVYFAWSESSYGAGKDNDEIVKLSLELVRNLPEMPEGLRLSIAVPDFYDTLVEEGKLTCGTVADFAKARNDDPKMIVLCHGNVATELKRGPEDELKNQEIINNKILLLVQVANHTSVRSGKIRRRDWNDLTKIMLVMRENAEKHDTFEGIISGPFGIIKTIQSEP